MKGLKGRSFLTEEGSIFFYISLALFIAMVILGNYYTALIAGAAILVAIRINSTKYEDRKKELNQYLIEFTNTIDDMSRQALLNFPIPLTIIGSDGEVHWYNSKFKEVVKNDKGHKDSIKSYFPNFSMKSLLDANENASFDIQYGTKNFNVIFSKIEANETDSAVYMLYFLDNTRFTNLKEAYSSEKTLVAVMYLLKG
jgi:c-di-AMP phosphodiesterase-like protein